MVLLAVGTPCGSFIFLNSSTSGRTALRPMGNEGLRGWVGSAPAQVVKRTLAGHLGRFWRDPSWPRGPWQFRFWLRGSGRLVGLLDALLACWTHCIGGFVGSGGYILLLEKPFCRALTRGWWEACRLVGLPCMLRRLHRNILLWRTRPAHVCRVVTLDRCVSL